VVFDDSSQRLSPLQRMTSQNKLNLKSLMDRITDNGGTDIFLGLRTGVKVLADRRFKNSVASVLLLTDGHDGSSNKDVGSLTRQVFAQSGVQASLFTFGFGPDHNAQLLRTMAETGHGMFYYLQELELVREAFANCLGGLLSVFAQKLQLSLLPVNDASIGQVLTSYTVSRASDGTTLISIPDLYHEEERDVPFVLLIPKSVEGDALLAYVQAKLQFTAVLTKEDQVVETSLSLKRCEGPVPSQTRNTLVDLQLNRWKTARTLERASELASRNQYSEAQKLIDGELAQIRTTQTANTSVVQHLLQDLEQTRTNVSSQSSYASGGNQWIQQQQQSHAQQRSNYSSPMYTTSAQNGYQSLSKRP